MIFSFCSTLRSTLYCGAHVYLTIGYYGFHFVMPPPPECVERFHCYHSNKKNIIASLLKFAGYIHNHKILPGNIFWPHFEKQDGRQGRLFDFKEGLLLAL